MALNMSRSMFVNLGSSVSLPPPVALESTEQISFGNLYKHCKSIHLPKVGGFVRLGTLSEYRSNENTFVNDAEEGIFHVSVCFPDVISVSKDWLRSVSIDTSPLATGTYRNNVRIQVFMGSLTAGSVFSIDSLDVHSVDNERISLSGALDISFEGADAFVLCLSKADAVGSVINDPLYNSVWSIDPQSITAVAQSIANSLGMQLSKGILVSNETVGPLVAPGFPPPPPLVEGLADVICVEIWEVKYRSRVIHAFAESEDIIQEVVTCVDESAFIKPNDFSGEKEVRIIFRPVRLDLKTGQKFLFPNYLKPAFVPFDDILQHCQIESDGGAT